MTEIKAEPPAKAEVKGSREARPMPYERVETTSQPMLYLTTQCSARPSTIAAEIKRSIATLEVFVVQHGIGASGPPLAIFSDWTGRVVTIEVGVPVTADEARQAEGRVLAGVTPQGPAARIVHRGSHTGIGEIYEIIQAELLAEGARLSGLSWEIYYNDPRHVPAEQLMTEIYVQLLDAPTTIAIA